MDVSPELLPSIPMKKYNGTCNNFNMGMKDLPDMYAQCPRTASPRAEGICIRQITRAHVTSNMYHF